MQKTLFGLVAGVACLTGLVMASEAKADVVYKKTTVVQRGGSYYRHHGVKYSRGYYFSGRHHNHWSHRTWNPHYRRYHYYEPTLRVYYYYDNARAGYYPCD
jgi:hypothetical protein